nr:hypothetical protein [Tanacetum cinerariifolium]
MPPRMRTQSAGRLAAESLRGGTSVRVGRGGRGRRPGKEEHLTSRRSLPNNCRTSNPPASSVGNQGNVGNQNGNAVNENVQ